MSRAAVRSSHTLALAFVCLVALIIGELGIAEAIVGRPLTPMSYAGVARRTTRRAVASGAATAPAVAVAAPATITTLPTGCVRAGAVYRCGARAYAPHYSGANVVYVQAP